jgi:hypothetical protein
MPKRQLKIDSADYEEEWIEGDYAFTCMEFTHASGMGGKSTVLNTAPNTVAPLDCFDSCREAVCSNIRDQIGHVDLGEVFDKTRLILYFRGHKHRKKPYYNKLHAEFERTITVGTKLVNLYEKELGWPLTKIYPLENDVSRRHIFYYVVGSKRWIKAPALLSLYMLLFRLGHLTHMSRKFSGRFSTFNGAMRSLNELASKKHVTGDLSYFKEHKDYWMFLLSNYKRLFGKRDMSDLWQPKQSYGGGLFSEGINTLCDHDTQDVKLKLAIEKVWKENEKK